MGQCTHGAAFTLFRMLLRSCIICAANKNRIHQHVVRLHANTSGVYGMKEGFPGKPSFDASPSPNGPNAPNGPNGNGETAKMSICQGKSLLNLYSQDMLRINSSLGTNQAWRTTWHLLGHTESTWNDQNRPRKLPESYPKKHMSQVV